jgi:hypothetical protein
MWSRIAAMAFGTVELSVLIAVDLDAPHLQHLLEVRRVAHLDLQEEDRYLLRDVVVLALLFFLRDVLLGIVDCSSAPVGDDVNLLSFTRFVDKLLCRFV